MLVSEPSVQDTISILRGLKEKYEVHHGVRFLHCSLDYQGLTDMSLALQRYCSLQVRITDGALVSAAVMSDRYIADRFLPDKVGSFARDEWTFIRVEFCSSTICFSHIGHRLGGRGGITAQDPARKQARGH